ncbi:MAG: aldo/keto reductase [Opitutales bacterium]|nr:aldo/keto reductase [Opitutales bacterium]MCH8541057.1 aldo/keto reductase [Opitutales bacterium]
MDYQADTERYQKLPYRRAGRSGLLLPPLVLGLWHNFGKKDDHREARLTLFKAFDSGITHFDLANNYGPPPGSAETFFGEVLQQEFSAYRDELIISTKAGYRMWPGPYGEMGSRKGMLASLDQSLQRLQLDYVDIFYSHRPDPDTPLEETMGALISAVEQGKALYVGLSNYRPPEARKALKILAAAGVPAVLHQPPYNMFNRWIEEEGLLDLLEEKGVGCVAFSPLSQGLLSDRYLDDIPAGSRIDKGGFLKQEALRKKLPKIRALAEIARERGQTLAQMALAWVLRDDRVTSALIGASSPTQVEENLAAFEKPDFAADELAAIEKVLAMPDAGEDEEEESK